MTIYVLLNFAFVYSGPQTTLTKQSIRAYTTLVTRIHYADDVELCASGSKTYPTRKAKPAATPPVSRTNAPDFHLYVVGDVYECVCAMMKQIS